MMIVDAHLDLADMAVSGRQVLLPARDQKPDEMGTPTVGLPDLRAGGIGLVCATIFCMPAAEGKPGYRDSQEAHTQASWQLEWYQAGEKDVEIKIVRRPADLPHGSPPGLRAILLMEGADPIRDDRDAESFFAAGVRIVGLTWARGTRYAGGNANVGPLTPEGKSLVKTLDRLRIIHDLSHLAEQSFWDLLQITAGPVVASHSNCRSIVPGERQLSDDMIRAITKRGGIIGINFYDRFLLPAEELQKRRATLDDVLDHMKRICDLAGDTRHVGLGTDMDGGFGRENIPTEIETSADLGNVADALSGSDFDDGDVAGIMGGNWLRFFRENLAGN
jgi:membrane dipeptidase